jgi:hypothetical protein
MSSFSPSSSSFSLLRLSLRRQSCFSYEHTARSAESQSPSDFNNNTFPPHRQPSQFPANGPLQLWIHSPYNCLCSGNIRHGRRRRLLLPLPDRRPPLHRHRNLHLPHDLQEHLFLRPNLQGVRLANTQRPEESVHRGWHRAGCHLSAECADVGIWEEMERDLGEEGLAGCCGIGREGRYLGVGELDLLQPEALRSAYGIYVLRLYLIRLYKRVLAF